MLRSPWGRSALAGILSVSAAVAAHAQAPTVAQLLAYRPTQKGVEISTPSAAEQAQCKVEAQGNSAWVLKDPQGRLLRRFASSRAGRGIDQWSYFKDGREVYREVDTTGNKGRPDKFMWIGLGGMKIGIDRDQNGTIDAWLALSPEELSLEVVRALIDKDWHRFRALLMTEEDLKSLGAPEREIARIRDLQKETASRFQQVVARFAHLNESTRWLHFEAGLPARLLAEATGMKGDVIMYFRGLILCETAGKTDTIQLGEIVQVGDTWKLLDAPLAAEGNGPIAFQSSTSTSPAETANPQLNQLMEKLAELDKQPVASGAGAAEYHRARADLLKGIVALVPAGDRLIWFKQLVDSLSAAIQVGDKKALAELEALKGQLDQQQAGSPLAAYVAYRLVTASYSAAMANVAKAEDQLALQAKYLEGLQAFVAAHPKAEDAPEALLQLGMIHEFQNKEEDAKKWYGQLVRDFSGARQAAKATGALRRLGLVGQRWELAASATPLNGQPFNPAALQGKVVIVYYWASWCQGCTQDLTKLGALKQASSGKGLEVVTINLDDTPAAAQKVLQQANVAGIHLHAAGGLDSPAVLHYGMVIFPQTFLLDKKGVVVGNNLDPTTLEAELKKLGF
jgi:thiol-disulfide isomerase/thioredoxin/uncharacterized coiled-coil protein SlyX